MTPRKPVRTEPITWEAIELAILTYDQERIIPRQDRIEAKRDRQHEENKAEAEKVNTRLGVIETFFTEWRRPAKFFMWFCSIVLSAILIGVIALVFDFVKWGFANHWHW